MIQLQPDTSQTFLTGFLRLQVPHNLDPSLITCLLHGHRTAFGLDFVLLSLLVRVFAAYQRYRQEHSRAYGDAHAF